ncbi:XRE family transcriptional regulator [Scytonema sp. HK-05]|uniref:helix-turn-helix domain-containing protein n=1 Tax=Scytonema sp. HK-05 TaxID=1137095 RepID=UPI0009368F68|nr:helix-turn-helix transcriptional regulator [Scytonema sp. HK-05]OKH59665.1 transcriptional regulator [Scytonema sp. HK-05]BAY47943.1 XRE family transcriptional regulator [Scytonema sp. HK-05]
MIIERPLVINQPQIGKLIRELRLETGLTQEKFAVKLGVTYPTINRWENGHTKPSPLAMQKIEEMLKHRDLYGQNLNFQENKQFYS